MINNDYSGRSGSRVGELRNNWFIDGYIEWVGHLFQMGAWCSGRLNIKKEKFPPAGLWIS